MSKSKVATAHEINLAAADWCQGDCIVSQQKFFFSVDPTKTIFDLSGYDEADLKIEQEVAGFAVVTQTCDIVRDCEERPYVEVCPLVQVCECDRTGGMTDYQFFREVVKDMRPNLAYLPGLEFDNLPEDKSHHLLVDLDRVMTVEKGLLAKWKSERIKGCRDAKSSRAFSEALARKRARVAFHAELGDVLKPLVKTMRKKHGKNSPEGEALECLREIRVLETGNQADSEKFDLVIWFIEDREMMGRIATEGRVVDLVQHAKTWMKRVVSKGPYIKVEHKVTSLAKISAEEYVSSMPLDLDHLSS